MRPTRADEGPVDNVNVSNVFEQSDPIDRTRAEDACQIFANFGRETLNIMHFGSYQLSAHFKILLLSEATSSWCSSRNGMSHYQCIDSCTCALIRYLKRGLQNLGTKCRINYDHLYSLTS